MFLTIKLCTYPKLICFKKNEHEVRFKLGAQSSDGKLRKVVNQS